MRNEEIILKFILAIIIGGVVGYERENKNRPAGFRTHILVCMGTTVVSLIQLTMAENAMQLVTLQPELAEVIKVDYARLGAQAVTGIGFLGAGTIVHSKGAIRGLTTAASLWVVGILGLAIGMGYYNISIIGGIFIVITLSALKGFQKKFITRARYIELEIIYENDKETLEYITRIFNSKDIRPIKLEVDKEEEKDGYRYKSMICKISVPRYVHINDIINNLIINENIQNVKKIS